MFNFLMIEQEVQYKKLIKMANENKVMGVFSLTEDMFLYLIFEGSQYNLYKISDNVFIKLKIEKRTIGDRNKRFIVEEQDSKYMIRIFNYNKRAKINKQFFDATNDKYLVDMFYDIKRQSSSN